MVVCCGDTFSATFQDCRFSDCTLYAVHGAAATLRRCALTLGSPAIVAHGPATCVSLHSCAFDFCVTAMVAERGATITQHRSTVQYSRTSIIARDGATHVTCTDSTFSGTATPERPASGVAVQVKDATVSLRRCAMDSVVHGVYISGVKAVVEVHECTILALVAGVTALKGAAFLLRNTDIRLCLPPQSPRSQSDQEPVAYVVCIHCGSSDRCGRRAQVERCHLSATGPEEVGIQVSEGGAVALTLSHLRSGGLCLTTCDTTSAACVSHCMMSSEMDAACRVQDKGASVRLVGGRVAGRAAGVQCVNGGMLTAQGTVITGARGEGAECAVMVSGGDVKLSHCSLQHAVNGVQVARGTLTAHDVAISDLAMSRTSGETAGYVQLGGQLSVKGGSVMGCGFGAKTLDPPDGADECGVIQLDRVLFEHNKAAVRMGRGASLSATCCVFSGTADTSSMAGCQSPEQVAVIVSSAAGAACLQRCTFVGDGQAVRLYGQQGHELSDCVFLGGHRMVCQDGGALLMEGVSFVQDCVFADAKCCITVLSRCCAVTGCHFLPGADVGVLVGAGDVAVSACRLTAAE